MDDVCQKILGRLAGKFAVKFDDDRLLEPEDLEIRQPLIERLQQRRRGFRMKDRTRMRVEGNGRRDGTARLCTLDDRLHDPLMPEMQPVKNASVSTVGRRILAFSVP